MISADSSPVGDFGVELDVVGIDGDVESVVLSRSPGGDFSVFLIGVVDYVEIGEVKDTGVLDHINSGSEGIDGVGDAQLLAGCISSCSESLRLHDQAVDEEGRSSRSGGACRIESGILSNGNGRGDVHGGHAIRRAIGGLGVRAPANVRVTGGCVREGVVIVVVNAHNTCVLDLGESESGNLYGGVGE